MTVVKFITYLFAFNILVTFKHGGVSAEPGGKTGEDIKPAPGGDVPPLVTAVELLADIFGVKCKYQCENGNPPVAKAGHIPSSNGCGTRDLKIDTSDIPGASDCCDEHDYCYDTCNSNREACDKEFKKCLHKTCEKAKTSNKEKYKDCRATVALMYSGTAALGCDAFLEAQENACDC